MAEVQELAARPDTSGLLRRGLPWLRPHRAGVLAGLGATGVSAGAKVAVAWVLGAVTDALLRADRPRVTALLVGLVVVILVHLVAGRWAEFLLARSGEAVVRDLRRASMQRVAFAPLRLVEAHRGGDLVQRTTVEVAELAEFVRSHLPQLVAVVASLVGTVVVLLGCSPALTALLVLVFVPPSVLTLRWFARSAGEVFGAQVQAQAQVTATLSELVDAQEELQVAGGSATLLDRFAAANDEAVRATRRAVTVENRIDLVSLVEGVSTAAVLVLGVVLVARGGLTVGTVVTFVLAGGLLFSGVSELSQLVGQTQTARTTLARLLDLLDRFGPDGSDAADRGDSGDSTPSGGLLHPVGAGAASGVGSGGGSGVGRGELVLSGVRFGYAPGHDVLRGADLVLAPGERLAVAGRTGSGKTTLMKVLSGLYRPDDGQVTYAGTELAALGRARLRSTVALVPQQVHLVSGSLADNLRLLPGEAAERRRWEQAVDDLGLREWLQDVAGGLDGDLGSRGGRLSAGQRQVVALVRAAVLDPAVLVLDEATADLDAQTAQRLEGALARLRAGRGVVVVAHDPATLARQDRVLVVQDGRLVPDLTVDALRQLR